MAWRRALNAQNLPDGRLSLEDGPIHLLIGVEGTPAGVRAGQIRAQLTSGEAPPSSRSSTSAAKEAS